MTLKPVRGSKAINVEIERALSNSKEENYEFYTNQSMTERFIPLNE